MRAAPNTSRHTSDWRDDALCRAENENPEDWFPIGAGPAAKAREHYAKSVCRFCPALQACGQWAIQTRQPFGVWGGMSEAERRAILRRRGVRMPADPDVEEAVA